MVCHATVVTVLAAGLIMCHCELELIKYYGLQVLEASKR